MDISTFADEPDFDDVIINLGVMDRSLCGYHAHGSIKYRFYGMISMSFHRKIMT
jgi:hypothetical protein